MSRKKIYREGFEEYMRKNYKKETAASIATKFHLGEFYVRKAARLLGLTNPPAKKQDKSSNGFPVGFTKENVCAITSMGGVIKTGNVTRHCIKC